jgi:hypothetical protein
MSDFSFESTAAEVAAAGPPAGERADVLTIGF